MNAEQLKPKAERSLSILETLLKTQNTKFAAGGKIKLNMYISKN